MSRKGLIRAKKGITFLSSIRKYLPSLVVASFLSLSTVIISIVSPNFVSDMTNEISDHAASRSIDMGVIGHYLLILSILYVTYAVFSYVSYLLIVISSQRYANSLRKMISQKINKMPLAYFDKTQIGDVLSRVTNDVDAIAQSIDAGISQLFFAIFMLLGSVIGMFVKCWQMALVAMASIPIMLAFFIAIFKGAMPMFSKRQAEIGSVQGAVEEKFSGQLIIKLFNAEKSEDAKFERKNKSLGQTMFKAQIWGGLLNPVSNFIFYLFNLAVFVTAAFLIQSKTPGVNIGTIAAFLIYIRLFQEPFTQVAGAINSLQTANAAAKRVFEFLREEEMPDDSKKKPLLSQHIKGDVTFKNVSFSYDPSKKVIKDFSAVIKKGMKVAIIGPTGAGKTTLVNLLMRFYEIDSGDILIDDHSIKDMPREEIHDVFGMVLQDTWVFEGTIRDNLVYNTKNLSEEDIQKAIKEVKLDHYISTLPDGLDYVIKDASSLSAGQRQLITIARAALRNNPLLILDEATSNVDTRTEEIIQEAMDKLMKNRTSFVIAHRLSTIKNADLILVMKEGNIVEQGTHEELVALNGFYASLYNSQFAFEG